MARLDGGEDGARARPQPVRHGEGGVARRADQLGAAQHGLGGDLELFEDELVVPADDDDVRARRERRPVDDPVARVRDVIDERLRADHERRAAPVALGEPELQRRADAEDVAERRLEAEPPELANERLGGDTDVIGEEQDRLTRFTQGGDGVDRAGDGFAADPDGSVQVEQHLVIRTDGWGKAHAPGIILARRVTPPRGPDRHPRAARRRLRLR